MIYKKNIYKKNHKLKVSRSYLFYNIWYTYYPNLNNNDYQIRIFESQKVGFNHSLFSKVIPSIILDLLTWKNSTQHNFHMDHWIIKQIQFYYVLIKYYP